MQELADTCAVVTGQVAGMVDGGAAGFHLPGIRRDTLLLQVEEKRPFRLQRVVGKVLAEAAPGICSGGIITGQNTCNNSPGLLSYCSQGGFLMKLGWMTQPNLVSSPDSISDPFLWARIVEKVRCLGRLTSEGCLKGLGGLWPAEEEALRAGAAEPP